MCPPSPSSNFGQSEISKHKQGFLQSCFSIFGGVSRNLWATVNSAVLFTADILYRTWAPVSEGNTGITVTQWFSETECKSNCEARSTEKCRGEQMSSKISVSKVKCHGGLGLLADWKLGFSWDVMLCPDVSKNLFAFRFWTAWPLRGKQRFGNHLLHSVMS